MWFLTTGPVVSIPMIFAELSEWKNCGCFFKKHHCHEQVQFFDIHRGFFSCLHLAVGRHHRRRILGIPHDLQIGRVKVSLAHHMHTCSGVHYKLSFLRVYGGCGQHDPLIGGRLECSLVFIFELVYVFGKVPCLASGASLLSTSLFLRPILKFHSIGTSLMRNFDLFFPSDGLLFSRTLAWRIVNCVNRTRRIDPKTLRLAVFPILLAVRKSWWLWVLRDTSQSWYSFSQWLQHVCLRFSFLKALCRLFICLFFNLVVRAQTLVSCFASRFSFIELTFGRMPTLERWSRTSTFQIVSAKVVEEFCQSDFCLWRFFSRLASTSCHWWVWGFRLSVSVLMHDHHCHAGNCTGLPSNTGLFLSPDNIYPFLFQRHLNPFDYWPLLLFQFSRVCRQSFATWDYDLYFFSPWSSIFDNLASISFDEFPCRTILVRFWVDPTHVSSICTDIPGHHQTVSLTQLTKFRRILCRIPEIIIIKSDRE